MKCKFCGQAAGFFKRQHPGCYSQHQDGIQQITDTLQQTPITTSTTTQLSQIAQENYVSQTQVSELIHRALEQHITQALDDDTLDDNELASLSTYIEHLPVNTDEVSNFQELNNAYALNQLHHGLVPAVVTNTRSQLPFLFNKNETLLWIEADVDYFEQKKTSHFVGGSKGISVRVAKGVYLRSGRFKGHRVESVNTIHKGTGVIAITTKHIYFKSAEAGVKIPLAKLISMEGFEDGIEVLKDGKTALPQKFSNADGCMLSNVIGIAQDF